MNENDICTEVSDLCYTWDVKGNCESCYKGYVVIDGDCVRDPNEFVPSVDSLCAEWKDRVCLKCAVRAYFDDNSKCVAVSDHCQTWDEFDGSCLSCYQGYDLNEGECVWSPDNDKGPDDLGCKTWDWQNRVCL